MLTCITHQDDKFPYVTCRQPTSSGEGMTYRKTLKKQRIDDKKGHVAQWDFAMCLWLVYVAGDPFATSKGNQPKRRY